MRSQSSIFKSIILIFFLSVSLFSSSNFGIPFVKNSGQFQEKSIAYGAKTYSGGFFVLNNGDIIHSLSKEHQSKISVISLVESINNSKKPKFTESQISNLRVNYLLGKKSHWLTDLETYKIVDYGEIYEGIDLKLHSKRNSIEKLFVLEPKANPNLIDISLKGAKNLRTTFDGRLIVNTSLGDVSFTRPVAWTEDKDEVTFVEVSYNLTKSGYGFKVGEYDKSKTLVIDPLLGSTFVGGSSTDEILDLDQNTSSGMIYAVGHTLSSIHTNLSLSPGRVYDGNKDGFIATFNSDLNETQYFTYLGGSLDDEIRAIDINTSDGSIYVTGVTKSSDFPPVSAHDSIYNNNDDGFITKLTPTLNSISASTFVGGSTDDVINDIGIDSSGYVYITGYTSSSSTSFTLNDGNDTSSNGNFDSFTIKYSPDLSTMINGTFLGGVENDGSRKIKVTTSNVFVGGFTQSPLFPASSGAYASGVDTFVVQYDLNLTDANATIFGGDGDDQLYGLDINASNAIVIAGTTTSDTAINGTRAGLKDGFLADFLYDLSAGVNSSSYLGGTSDDEITDLVIDTDNNESFVIGYTSSNDFNITNGVYQSTFSGISDVFISKFTHLITDLNASTYLGGTAQDMSGAIYLDSSKNIFAVGTTSSSNFPTSNITGDTLLDYSSDKDGFIIKMDNNLSENSPEISTTATSTNGNYTTNPAYLHFENIILGEESDEIVISINNTGTDALTVNSIDLNNTGLGYTTKYISTATNPCSTSTSFTVDAKSSCSFALTFTPSVTGEANATLTLTHTATEEHNISVDAIGVLFGVQNIKVSPTSYDFTQTTSIGGTLTSSAISIRNIGNSNLVLSDINMSDGNFSIDTSVGCGSTTATINPDSNCSVAVVFSPTDIGDYNGTLSIKSNDPDTPIYTLPINAQAVTGLNTSTILDFGNVASGATLDKNITITNGGSSSIQITSLAPNTGTYYSVAAANNGCDALPTTLVSNEECNVSITFSPAALGTLTDTFVIDSNDSVNPELNVSLTGVGVAPSAPYIESNVSSYNFGNVILSSDDNVSDIKISNTGLADLTITAMTPTDASIISVDATSGSSPCGTTTPTITAGNHCTISIGFAPSTQKTYEENLTITSDASNGDLNITLYGVGITTSYSAVSITGFSASPTYGTSPLTTNFTVTPSGGSGVYDYLWNFDDGNTSTAQNPSKVFDSIKDYNVSVKVSDNADSSNFVITETNISVTANYSPITVSSLNISPSAGSAPLTTTFTLAATGGSGSYSYLWNFGDAATSTLQSPSHTYTTDGNYSVGVTVTDTMDATKTTESNMSVLVLANSSLSTSLSATPTSGVPPFDVTFSGTISGGTAPYTVSWNYGDGNTYTQSIGTTTFTNTHTFTSSGEFATTVTISDSTSASMSTSSISSSLSISATGPTVANAATSNGSSGDYCFIATAAYGSLLEPEVVVLREFRDNYLLTNSLGKAFVSFYYKNSPPIAQMIAKNEILKTVVRVAITPAILIIKHFSAFAILLLLTTLLIIQKQGRLMYHSEKILKI